MSISLKPATVAPGGGRGPAIKFTEEAQFLKEHSGEWFELRTMKDSRAARAAAGSIRKGVSLAFVPAGHFEAQAQATIVIARYVGESK